jgi:hypothetical protein
MGGAKAMGLRLQLIEGRKAGKTLEALSQTYQVSYGTVQGLCARYKQLGELGLKPRYANCGNRRRDGRDLVYRAVRCFKTWHPKWGAEKIRAELLLRGPGLNIPPTRTLQQWFVYNGQNRRQRSKIPQSERQWAKAVHEVWQVDGKEELRTLDERKNCWLNITDECSGGIIHPKVFPPEEDL